MSMRQMTINQFMREQLKRQEESNMNFPENEVASNSINLNVCKTPKTDKNNSESEKHMQLQSSCGYCSKSLYPCICKNVYCSESCKRRECRSHQPCDSALRSQSDSRKVNENREQSPETHGIQAIPPKQPESRSPSVELDTKNNDDSNSSKMSTFTIRNMMALNKAIADQTLQQNLSEKTSKVKKVTFGPGLVAVPGPTWGKESLSSFANQQYVRIRESNDVTRNPGGILKTTPKGTDSPTEKGCSNIPTKLEMGKYITDHDYPSDEGHVRLVHDDGTFLNKPVRSIISDSQNLLKDDNFLLIPTDSVTEIYILDNTQIKHGCTIYATNANIKNSKLPTEVLFDLHAEIIESCQLIDTTPYRPVTQEICFGEFRKESWRRAICIKVGYGKYEDKFLLRNLDGGGTEWTLSWCIRKADMKFFVKPFLASKIFIEGQRLPLTPEIIEKLAQVYKMGTTMSCNLKKLGPGEYSMAGPVFERSYY